MLNLYNGTDLSEGLTQLVNCRNNRDNSILICCWIMLILCVIFILVGLPIILFVHPTNYSHKQLVAAVIVVTIFCVIFVGSLVLIICSRCDCCDITSQQNTQNIQNV